MNNFIAPINADLNLNKAKKDLNSFLSKNYKIDIQVNTKQLDGVKKQLNEVFISPTIKPTLDTRSIKTEQISALSETFNEVAISAKNAGDETQKLSSHVSEVGQTIQKEISSAETSLSNLHSQVGNMKLSQSINFEIKGDLSNIKAALRGIDAQLKSSQNNFGAFNNMLDNTAKRWNNLSTLMQQQKQPEEFKKQSPEPLMPTIDSSSLKNATDAGSGLLDVFTEIINTGSGLAGILQFMTGKTLPENLDWGKSSHKLNLPLSESIIMEKIA